LAAACLGCTSALVAFGLAGRRIDYTNLIDGSGLLRNRKIFGFDFESQAVVGAHVHVGDPDQREFRDDKPAPSSIEHLKPGEEQEQCGHVVTGAVLAGEQIEEFSLIETLAVLALLLRFLRA
jgi:hypothetical protein